MIVDDPETLAEVTALFAAYEQALVTNDVAALDGFFRDAPQTIRYGVRENLYGYRGDSGVSRRAPRSGAGAHAGAHGDHHLWPRSRDLLDDVPPREQRAGRAPDADLGALSRGLAHRRGACQPNGSLGLPL